MAKGVIINLNSGSDYTDCSVYTGLTEMTATGSTVFTSVTGGTINLEGLSDALEEVYVKIVCVGCCEQIFYVCLNSSTPTPTPTPTVTVTSSQTVTPTITATPDQPCYCYTYEVTSSEATINYITCDNVVTNISGVTSGATQQICSIVDPVAIEGTAIITLTGICVDGNCPTPTPTPTPTVTITNTPTITPTVTITQSVTPTITPTVTPEIPVTNITLYRTYQLVQFGTTYSVYNTTSDLTTGQSVYCQIAQRENGANVGGGIYKHYGPLGVGVQLFDQALYPAANFAGYYGTGGVAAIGGVFYYVRTDGSGYVTHYGLVNYCGDSHTINECFNTCVSGNCFCDNSTATTVYMEVSFSPLDINNVIYADSACTIPWHGDYEYSNTIYSSNPTIQIICNPGGPC